MDSCAGNRVVDRCLIHGDFLELNERPAADVLVLQFGLVELARPDRRTLLEPSLSGAKASRRVAEPRQGILRPWAGGCKIALAAVHGI